MSSPFVRRPTWSLGLRNLDANSCFMNSTQFAGASASDPLGAPYTARRSTCAIRCWSSSVTLALTLRRIVPFRTATRVAEVGPAQLAALAGTKVRPVKRPSRCKRDPRRCRGSAVAHETLHRAVTGIRFSFLPIEAP